MKICRKCNEYKSILDFGHCKKTKDKLNSWCKPCLKVYNKSWHLRNLETTKIYNKSKTHKLSAKNWAKKNKNYSHNRRKVDINFKLSVLIRNRIYSVTKGFTKVGSSVKNLGCSLDELKTYIESKFQPGMTWENQGKYGWHIDHIKPLSSFDLTDPVQFLKACHYTNLQPLWAEDNLKKSNKFSEVARG